MASAEVNTANQTQPIFWNHLGNWIRLIPRSALLSMMGPSLLLLIGYFGWRFYGAKSYDAAFYGLRKENLILTQPPVWLKDSIVEQVFHASGLENLSLLDSQTPAVLARTIDQHPAVRKTHRVQPVSGGQIFVSVEYRTPVAMVHCELNDEIREVLKLRKVELNTSGDDLFVPIDKDGVLLPESNFSQSDVMNYLWIYADELKFDPDWKHGNKFTDPRIIEAARLCNLLAPYRSQVKAERVVVVQAKVGGKSPYRLAIETASPGPTVVWGEAPELPSMEGSIDPVSRSKISKLLDAASDRNQWSKGLIDLTK
ncbi:MAG: hypothetical protein NTY42_23410 [Planctomycetota bacterium]|jgi:hypothetical protein|nr:hypothetical protein [Planctomycetota bacterium]